MGILLSRLLELIKVESPLEELRVHGYSLRLVANGCNKTQRTKYRAHWLKDVDLEIHAVSAHVDQARSHMRQWQ